MAYFSVCVLFCVWFSFVGSFLLDPNGAGTNANKDYLTLSQFFDAKSKLQDGINDLRHDMDTKLTMLTKQLQQTISSSQVVAENKCRNDTKRLEEVEQEFKKLLENHTKLSENFVVLQSKYMKQEKDLAILHNKTDATDRGIANLTSLKNIHQLRDFSALSLEVQSIRSQTNSILATENARKEDFRALYNLTVVADNRITEFGKHCEIKQNLTLKTLDQKILKSEIHQSDKIDELRKGLNLSLSDVQAQITRNNEKVALTACISSAATHSSGYVWRFDDIRTQNGINNLSSFKTTGKFTCESYGLYLVSVWIESSTQGSNLYIYKNGNAIVRLFVTSNSRNEFYTGTAVVAVELGVHDTVWVSPTTSMIAHNSMGSCLTIVKMK